VHFRVKAVPRYEDARRLGRRLAEAGLAVCNGGYERIDGSFARGAREAGGQTIGITCVLWPRAANPWIVEECAQPPSLSA